jgi:hypothetical protein
MKPHPRIRKTIKWGGAAVTVLLVVVWVVSLRWYVGWWFSNGAFVQTSKGGMLFGSAYVGIPAADAGAKAGVLDGRADTLLWSHVWHYPRGWHAVVPAWIFVGIAGLVTAAAWHLDTLARRRARLSLCPKCNYDRAGLSKDAVCPECGNGSSRA